MDRGGTRLTASAEAEKLLAMGEPLLAYNFTVLISLSLSAFITYLLVLKLTQSPHAGVLAGVAFAAPPTFSTISARKSSWS